ncbi:MAG: hypothetical protein IJT16_02235, partial [Lachnospiraceae bacterium]|nr:hypothetical protein [Lachnospiraceae bacterium]
MKRWLKRLIGVSLSAAIFVTSIPVPAEAHWDTAGTTKPTKVKTTEKGTVAVEDDWESIYPYGAFLFDNSDAILTEGGEEISIPIYRLGGTSGRATAYVVYAPVVTYLNEETPAYGSAAGIDDVKIRIEDTLPIAQYQAIGKDPDPERSSVKIKDAVYTGDDATEGDKVLSVSVTADSYQWYVFYNGSWEKADGAESSEFVVSSDLLKELDIRCVFTQGEKSYSTDSYKGETYIRPEPEELSEMPNDLDLKPDQTFSELEMDKDNPYNATVFSMTFAEGEWKKEIRVKAPDNEKAQPMRFGTFTIADHSGGAVYTDASTVTLQLLDNDESEPYTIDFEETEITADRADGTAVVKLKRNGGGQDAVTVDWETADGTAKAGRDYESTNGTAVFYADVDEVTIEIPLLEGKDDGKALTFEVKLGEMKGDNKGLCTLTEETAKVSITGTGSGKASESEISGPVAEIPGIMSIEEGSETVEDDEPVIGREVIVPEDELLYGEIAGFDYEIGGSEEDDGEIPALKTYNYGEISFKGNHEGSYWGDTAYVAGKASNDIPAEWSSGGSYGNGWQLSSDDYTQANLKIAFMPQMYSAFNGKFEFSARLDNGWHIKDGWCYGEAGLVKESGYLSQISSNPQFSTSGFLGIKRHLSYTSGGSIKSSWGIDSGVSGIRLQTSKHNNKSRDDAYSRITSGYFTRRTFDNNLRLRIHTANDGESGNGNVATAPSGAASLKEDSGVYKSMKPEVMVVTGKGGVTSKGRLYVGSKVSVALTTTASYMPYSGSALNSAVYVTRKNGESVPADIQGGNGVFTVTLVWDGMTEDDLKDEYTLNLVMTRSQEIELNLRPSVERKLNRDGSLSQEIDTDKIGDTWDTFWKSGSDTITVGISEATKDAPHYDSKKVKEITISKSDWQSGDKNPLKSLGNYENIQYINFNRNKNDGIVFNGKTYKGNEKITLSVEALAFPKLNFSYYRAEYLDKPNTMEAFINRVELYLDADGDGRISGKYNENTGYFVLDSNSDDEFIEILEEGAYDESTFTPVILNQGGFGAYFVKVYYTMTPRYLVVPKGVDTGENAQVLPAFVTSRTDPEKLSELSEEQRQYRYLLSGKKEDGTRTSDGHTMYGEAATALNYVDVPLGGDHSPLYETEPGSGEYRWSPDYVGNLIYPYKNPSPIMIEQSLLGKGLPLVDFEADTNNGTTVMTDAARACTNGYLGSFTADTDIALCVEAQEHTADELNKDPETLQSLKIESTVLTGRTAAANGAYNSEGADGNGGSNGFDTGDSGQPMDQFNVDYNADLRIMKESFQGFATIAQSKNKITIMISIPVVSTTNKSGGENAGKWKKSVFPKTVTTPIGASADQITSAFSDMKGGHYDKLIDTWDKQGYKDTAKGGGIKSSSKSFTLSFSVAFTLKYDTRDNAWYMAEFAFGAAGSFKFSYTIRLAPCPIVYAFVSVSPAITIGTGGTILHTAVESDKAIVSKGQEKQLKKGQSMVVATPYINMNIQFEGKIYLEAMDSEKAGKAIEGSNKGILTSKGEDKIQVQFMNLKDSMTFDSKLTPKYVRIVAMDGGATIKYLNNIEYIRSQLVWSGFTIAPAVNVEAGGGVGVEGFKGEVFAKIVLSANFYLGKEAADESLSSGVANVNFGVSVAVRGVLLMMSWEMDIIGIRAAYDGDKDKWTGYYTVLGKEKELKADEASGAGGGLKLPVSYSDTQTIYSSQPVSTEDSAAADGDIDRLLAYNPDDVNVPFQLSGYNSSGEAIRLFDGVDVGYDYRVVTVDGVNYVLYTISRPNGQGMDTTMLVMSRLVMTGEGYGQNEGKTEESFGDGLGLINPLDWAEVEDEAGNKHNMAKAPNDRSETPYLIVDLAKDDKGNLVDDGTGDLGFDVKVFGNEIRVAWVSYKDKMPDPDANDMTKVLQDAVKNTVVKQATYDVTQKDGFSEAKVISDPDAGAAVYLPTIISDDLTAFVQAQHVSESERTKLVDQYEKKLNRLGYSKDSDEVKASIYNSRKMIYENNLDYKGDASTIYVYGSKDDELYEGIDYHMTPTYPSIKPIDRIKGLQMQEGKQDIVYLAYTTWEEDMGSDSGLDDHNAGLYILGMDAEDADPYMEVDLLSDFSYKLDSHKYFDALEIYDEGIRYDAIGMNDKDLLIVGQDGKIYTIHFYTKDNALAFSSMETTEFYGGSADEKKTAYAFGADGAGNLATVYIHKVENTSNTGLYISRYDERTRTWGKGVLLAMRYMDVHEDAAKNDWDDETTDKAFLGKLDGYKGGGMDQFQFDNPQIALGTRESAKAQTTATGEVDADDLTSSQTTLVIMTQGVMRYLEERTPDDPNAESFLVPTDTQPSDARFPKGMGIYAISYGVGNQSIGEATLSFLKEDFTAGALLTANLSFINTGDISIRGSEKNPVKVSLSVNGDGIPSETLKSWELTENIVPGREIVCAGDFTLPVTLPEGAGFTISLSEDETYAEDPYSATLRNVYVVEGKRELGFEDASIELSRQDNGKLTLNDEGNVVLNVDLFVGNRGLSDAGDVKLQFSYGVHDPAIADQVRELKGQESDWNDVIYSALDITDNTLTVGEEEALAPRGAGEDKLKQGILTLDGIRTGYGRHVRGTVTIPADKFRAFGINGEDVPAGSLILRVEIFCGDEAGESDAFGICQIEHDEYNVLNNVTEAIIDHTTAYTVPSQLILPMGSTLRLPVSFSSTLGSEEPVNSAVELTDREEANQMMDIVSFERGTYTKGAGRGTLIIRGTKTGTGYVRIQDEKTNAYQDIAIEFTDADDGIFISNSTGIFTFLDESGKAVKTSGNSWQFGASKYADSLRSSGKPGTSFKFTTEAETIDIEFDGEIFVTSDKTGFRNGTLKSDGGVERFTFGTNPDHTPHTVTVTVKNVGSDGKWALFTKLLEYYDGENFDIEDWTKENSLSLLWDSHFPTRGSLNADQVFDAKLFILSDSAATDRVQDNGVYEVMESEELTKNSRIETIRFKKNGQFKIEATNQKGASQTEAFQVDWWNENGEKTEALVSGSPALSWYETKYPDITLHALGIDYEPEVLDNKWMSAKWVKEAGVIRVHLDDDAPLEEMEAYVATFDEILSDTSEDKVPTPIRRGESIDFPAKENEFYIAAVGADKEGSGDPALSYKIIDEEGNTEEYNGEDAYYVNYESILTAESDKDWDDEKDDSKDETQTQVVQNLSGNKLTFDSISDGDTLYLLKGGKYTYEEGLDVVPFAKGAVKLNAKKGLLTIKKDSLLTFKKGSEEKSVLLRAVTIKKKTITLSSRREKFSLDEIFAGAGELLPDLDPATGRYAVSVKSDKNGILDLWDEYGDDYLTKAEAALKKNGHITLADFTLGSTGKKGSATITAVFGGVTVTATVKCQGYPLLDIESGTVVQNLKEADAAGNRVLTWDAVGDRDTLILTKGGKYAIEAGVDIEPADAAYKNAVKVSVNKKTGIRKLAVKKEAPVILKRTAASGVTEEKLILIHLVSVRKNSVTLTAGESCTFAELFPDAYELLPDPSGKEEYGGYAVTVTDKDGVLSIDEAAFPDVSENDTRLRDFKIGRINRKGSAQVAVSFG